MKTKTPQRMNELSMVEVGIIRVLAIYLIIIATHALLEMKGEVNNPVGYGAAVFLIIVMGFYIGTYHRSFLK